MPKLGAKADAGTRNVEIVRATYDALNRRDIDRLLAVFDEDFELHDHGTGFTQRAEEFRAWIAEYFESWEHYRETPQQLTPVDDRVIARVRTRGLGRLSRADMEDEHGEVHTLRDGRITQIAVYPTYALALKAVGLEDLEPGPTDRSAGRRGGRFRPWRWRR
jgi:ketosteroid isomerase-like protein